MYSLKKKENGIDNYIYALTSFGTGVKKKWQILFDDKKRQTKRRVSNKVFANPILKKQTFTWKDIEATINKFSGKYHPLNYNCVSAVKIQWEIFFEG